MTKLIAIVCCIALCACHVGDYFGTTAAIKSGNGYEANPFVRKIGLIPAKLIGIGLSVFLAVFAPPAILIALTVGICALYAWAIHKGFSIAKRGQ